MVKSLISVAVAFMLLIGGAFVEHRAIEKNFEMFSHILEDLQHKTQTEQATEEDALAVQKWWLDKKKHFHTYIPHDDIKEIDNWLAEATSYIHTKNYEHARARLEVLIEICEQIPGAYSLKFENIF